MSRAFKIILLIIFVPIALFLLAAFLISNPVESIYQKSVLMRDPILSQLGLQQSNCTYSGPVHISDTPMSARFDCLTADKISPDDRTMEFEKMGKTLAANGWSRTDTHTSINATERIYGKDDRQILIMVYPWSDISNIDKFSIEYSY